VKFFNSLSSLVNTFYYFKKDDIYNYIDIIVAYFKYQLLKSYFIDNTLFENIIQSIITRISSLLQSIEMNNTLDLNNLLLDLNNFDYLKLIRLLNNYTFGCKMGDYTRSILKEYTIN